MSKKKLVKHIFLDRECGKSYSFWTTKEDQQKILTDKNFSLKIFKSAKDFYAKKSNSNKNSNGPQAQTKVNDEGESTKKEPEEEIVIQDEHNKLKPISLDIEKKEKYNWQYDDTKALINSYRSHLRTASPLRHKKKFWDIIAKDLRNQQYNVTSDVCHTKWNNLLRSYYKQTKDKSRRRTRFLFFPEMNKIFGKKPCTNASSASSSCVENKKQNSEKVGEKRKHFDDEERKEIEKRKFEIQKKRLELEEQKLSFEKTKCDLIKQYLELIQSRH